MVDATQYFDIFDVLVNELIGGEMLFVIVAFLALYWAASKYNINFQVTLLLSVVLLGGLGLLFDSTLLWVLTGLVAGGLFFYMISTIVRRG